MMKINEIIKEDATVGSTSAANIATVPNPNVAIGSAATRKKYGKGKSVKPPKAVSPKNSDGTVKNAQDISNVSLFGAPLKR